MEWKTDSWKNFSQPGPLPINFENQLDDAFVSIMKK